MTAADIVSNAKIVMTAIVFMETTSLPIVAENVRAWRIFGTKPGNNHGRRRNAREGIRSTGGDKARSISRWRRARHVGAEMPQEPLLFGYHLFRLKTNAQLRKVRTSNLNSVC